MVVEMKALLTFVIEELDQNASLVAEEHVAEEHFNLDTKY
jgi:hypothetical protein